MHSDSLLPIALDLSSSLFTKHRYQRLLSVLMSLFPSDAACLFLWKDEVLTPVATQGLVPETMGCRFSPKDHPRLDLICRSQDPKRFPADCKLPDPFDGLVEKEESLTHKIHACLGCPLRIEGKLVGVLTLDAFDPNAFDLIDDGFLGMLAALSGASIQTAMLIETLESRTVHDGLVKDELMKAAFDRCGGDILGVSQSIEKTRQELELVAQSDLNVLITGESGVGKELVARAIHKTSLRRHKPMIYVNCAALPENLAESELFGHVRGAFTGADRKRAGKFRTAHSGTLLLDEIGELPLPLQAKLLRALQSGEIQSIGEDRTDIVDVRVLAATNRDLKREVALGRFRPDLFHRLFVYPIRVPPLRERRSDIPILAGHFVDKARRRMGLRPTRLSAELRTLLKNHDWPGNVRQLENLINRMLLKANANRDNSPTLLITSDFLDSDFNQTTRSRVKSPINQPERSALEESISLNTAVDNFKREIISKKVKELNGNWSAAARSLGLHRGNLHHLAQRLGLK
jgi:anaerobic nitric oxide reductase transcription regulator